MPDKKKRKNEEDTYMDMGSLSDFSEEIPNVPTDENIYEEMKLPEFDRGATLTEDVQKVDALKFRDQHRPSVTGKKEPPVIDLTCNCAVPCEGPCTNGLVGKKVILYESLLTDYQKEIQSSKAVETSIEPPPRKKKSFKREFQKEVTPAKHTGLLDAAVTAKKNLAHYFSSSSLETSNDESRREMNYERRSPQIQEGGFRSLITSTPIHEDNNSFPLRNSSLPDLHTAGEMMSESKSVCSFEEHSLQRPIADSDHQIIPDGSASEEDNQNDSDHKTNERSDNTPEKPSRKKSGILSVHAGTSSDKHENAHHAKFSFPAITNVKRQNELLKTNSSIRASVNILDMSKRTRKVPITMRKADSVAALTPHEHENPSNLNVRRRLDKRNRMKTLRKRINKAFGLQNSNSSCWPKAFRRKKMSKRSNSGKRMTRYAKPTSQSTESFATIFMANEKRLSSTLPDNWKNEVISEELFTADAQESIEFPEYVSMPAVKGKNKRRTLRERLLSPKRLLSKDSTTSLDSVALKKAISFLESSLHPTGSNNENDQNVNEKSEVIQSLKRQESDEYVGASSETLDSITSARSAGCVQRAMSHDSSTEQDFFKKISLKTKFFLRTASIPDMAPRILNAFSKTSSSTDGEKQNSNENLERSAKPGKYSNRLKRDTLAHLGSLFSTEPITENEEEEDIGENASVTSDTCTAEVHGIKSVVTKTESQNPLEDADQEDKNSNDVDAFPTERKPSIVVTDENLHDHLVTAMENGSEKETQLPIVQENIDRDCKFSKDAPNSEHETITDNLLSPQDIPDNGDGDNKDDFFDDFEDNCDFSDGATDNSMNVNSSNSSKDLHRGSESDTVSCLTESSKKHEGIEQFNERERSESTNIATSESEYSDNSIQLMNNSEETNCGDKTLQKLEIHPSSPTFASESKALKQFAVSISPVQFENTEVPNEQNGVVHRVLKTERCVDTGRTVISYNAPLNGEQVKIDLHEIDPSVIPVEKCADTGRTVISCKGALDRLESLENTEGNDFEALLAQETSVGNISSDKVKHAHDNDQDQNLRIVTDTNSSDLNQLWDNLENSSCNDCESPSCGVPIVSIEVDLHQEETIVPDELHQEITSWKRNMGNEGYFKTNTRSNLLPPDDRRRIRANSIPESDFEFDEECDDEEHNCLRQTIKDGLRNRGNILKSDETDEKENDQNGSAKLPVTRVTSSDNILKITKNDDFFDFFRDRAQEEHYAYILESDSENEEECAKAVVEYLVNARRGSVDTLLSHKTDDPSHLQLQKVNVETGSLALSDCSSRRSSKIEPSEPIKDDIFNYFDGTGNSGSENDMTMDCPTDEIKCNSNVSKTSEDDITTPNCIKDPVDNLASNVSNSDTTDTMPANDTNINEFKKADEISSLQNVENVSIDVEHEQIDQDGSSVGEKYDNMNNDDTDNCTAKNSDCDKVTGHENVPENGAGVLNKIDVKSHDDTNQFVSANAGRVDDCHIEIITEVHAQKTYSGENNKTELQSVENTEETVHVKPETDANGTTEMNKSTEKLNYQTICNDSGSDNNCTEHVQPTIIVEKKHEIVQKDDSNPNSVSDLLNKQKPEKTVENALFSTTPSKPPRLFTVRLIPEHAWRSKSNRDYSRNSSNSLQPETRDLLIAKSFDDIPRKVDSVSEMFPERVIIRKVHSDERLPLRIDDEGKTLIPSIENSNPQNCSNESVEQVSNLDNEAISLKLSKSKLSSRNYSLCPDETDDFFDYFKDDSSADDDIELLAERNTSAEMELSSKTYDDNLRQIPVTISLTSSDNGVEKNSSIDVDSSIDTLPVQDIGNDTAQDSVITNDVLAPNSLEKDDSNLGCTAATDVLNNKQPQKTGGLEASDSHEDCEPSNPTNTVGDPCGVHDGDGDIQSHENSTSGRILDVPKLDVNRKGSFLQEKDDFFDYFNNADGTSKGLSRAVIRQYSSETSDVTGFSVFQPGGNCCENHYNSNAQCKQFCDSVPMLETKMAFSEQDCGDQLPTVLSDKAYLEEDNCSHSNLSDCNLSSSKNGDTSAAQHNSVATHQLPVSGTEVKSDDNSDEINANRSTSLHTSELCDAATPNLEVSPEGTQDLKQGKTPDILPVDNETLPGSEVREEPQNSEPCDNTGKINSADCQSNTLLSATSETEQNRRGSFLEEKDDFFNYFDVNEGKEGSQNSSENVDIGNLCLVNESKNDSALETQENVTPAVLSPEGNSTEIIVNRRGSFIEDDDDFFDYFRDDSKKANENNEHVDSPQNKSSSSVTIEQEKRASDISHDIITACQDNEIIRNANNHSNNGLDLINSRPNDNSSDELDIEVSLTSSKSSRDTFSGTESPVSQLLPHESEKFLSKTCGNEQMNLRSDETIEQERLTPPLTMDDEETGRSPTPTEDSSSSTYSQPVNDHENDVQSSEVRELEGSEHGKGNDPHHIESIIKKDHTPAGPRRRSVTFNLPLIEIPPEPLESSIMVSYCSTEDPFEYFSTSEPVAPTIKDDPFDYFTTSSMVSASSDIDVAKDDSKKIDSQLNEGQNVTNTNDESTSDTDVDHHQHGPHHHDPHIRESHSDLLPIVEANPDQLAIEEASYASMKKMETNCSLHECDPVEPPTEDDGLEKLVTEKAIADGVEVNTDSRIPASSQIGLNKLQQSVNLDDSNNEHDGEEDKADDTSQQKPVILKLVPKETSDVMNDSDTVLETSSNELSKPSLSECLIELPVAKVFEIIDFAEKTGSIASLTKVAEEFVSNSPQYRTKFQHNNASCENRRKGSSFSKTMSMSYETLLDSVDGPCNKTVPFSPTYCHAWKSLFPNVSTSNLSNLEQMDDNYSPRSLALGRPTIILQTWFERQKQGDAFMKPARSSSDLVELFSRFAVPQNSPSVARSESLPPRKRPDTPSPGTPVDQFKEDTVEEHPPRQEERVQKDRSLDVYPETLRQRQRHRNMAPSPSKVDIKNWNQNDSPIREQESPASGKKFLPSVKALRSQFETGKSLNSSSSNNGSVSPTSTFSMSSSSSHASTGSTQGCGGPLTAGGSAPRTADPSAILSRKLSGSSLASSSLEKSSSNTSLNSAPSTENLLDGDPHDPDEPVEPIFCQFQKVDEELRELMSRPTSTSGWDPRSLMKRLYYVPEVPRVHSKGHSYINIEGYLEKLPSGRKKATFWNAWKKRYFVAKDGVLYYYQNSQCDKQSLRLTLMGGKVETMEGNMVGVDDGVGAPEDKAALMLSVDDGKGHYVVVRCSSRSEAERWRRALESQLIEDFASQYVQPHPMSTNPSLLRDTLIIDIGSCSVRAGVLSSQATLPQLFFPSVVATDRESRRQVWGPDALAPETRTSASLTFPMKPSHRISKYSVDLTAVSSLLAKTFNDLKVDPKNYNLQISVPRVLNQHTQSELLKTLFEKFGVKGVNVTHQSILALYAYNATSGIVVDIGERMDIVPVTDGYIVEGGVSRVPYGGCRILDHLRQFLYMRNVSLVNDVESYIIRHVLESACYCAQHYNTEKARCTNHPENFEKIVPLKEFFPNTAQCPYDAVELDFGRFQATEGLFNPDAWGLDHPGLHKLVHKAIQECSMDIRKEMSRSIFLAGGVTQLPGLADRLTTELDNLTPPAIRPKVHVSPYRYHAAYIGACTLAESPAFSQTLITRENWAKNGNAALRKWAL